MAALVFLLVAMALLGASSAAAQPPPNMEVAFVFDPASVFVSTKLTPTQQIQVRDYVSARLAELCSLHFGFFHWQTVGQTRSALAGRLTVTLRDVAKQRGNESVLELAGRRGSVNVSLPRIGRIVIYPWFELSRPSDPVELGDRIVQELEDQFKNEAFRRELHLGFLRSVPLAREVLAQDEDQRIVVPLSWDELRPASDTVLLVKFVVAQSKAGEMYISRVKKRLGRPRVGSLQGAIKLFDCAPLTLNTLGAWNPQISTLLAGATEVRVFMESYVQDAVPDVDAGLIISPN